MPARGHREKAMLKLKRSFDSALSFSSSPARSCSTGSSPVSPLSFESGLSEEGSQVSPVSYSCDSFQANTQATNPFSQHSRVFGVDPIVTQFNSASTYAPGTYTNNSSFPSSTITHSSSESGSNSAFPSQGIPSAVSLPTHLTWPPTNVACIPTPTIDSSNVYQWTNMPKQPCNLQQVGDLTYPPPLSELSEANLSQETANMEDMTFLLTGTGDTEMKYSDVQPEFLGEYTSFLQNQWNQRQEFSSFAPESLINSPAENGIALEVAGSTYPAPDSFSPVSSDVAMGDTPPMGGDSPAAASDMSIPKCTICKWEPDTSVRRSLKRLAAAVEKHITRNHRSRDSQCPICYQVFKNRPDNVKPHVARKHPEKLASLYPTKAVLDGPQDEKPATPARAGPKRRASMPQSASVASTARGRHMRFKRG